MNIKNTKNQVKYDNKFYDPNFDWNDITFYYNPSNKLSEEFIKEFQDKINWRYVCESQTLSEDFIREFADKVNWYGISTSQKLSENFIREFQNKVIWHHIIKFQNISSEFKKEVQLKVEEEHKKCMKELKNKEYVSEIKQLLDNF